MADLSEQEVAEIALLARLSLTDQERASLRAELGAILGHMDALAEVDTDGVEPMTHAVPMTLRLRADTPSPSLPASDALGGTTSITDSQFRVPHIIKKAGASE